MIDLKEKNQARMKPGRNMPKSKSVRRTILDFLKVDPNRKYCQDGAKERRRKQIAKGQLTESNGLVIA